MRAAFGFFKILPLDVASGLGGFIFRNLGMLIGATRKARKNLEIAFPGLSKGEQDKILLEMWDNLGRVMAEYPHLETIARKRTVVENQDIIDQVVANKSGAILVASHLANWEINGANLYTKCGVPLHLTYRALNNPYADKILHDARTLKGKLPAYAKSREGGRQILNTLKTHQILGMLIDQKYNEGLAVPFFGKPAMSNPVYVQLAQKYKCPAIPVQAIRLKGAHFKIKVYPPLGLFDPDGKPFPVENVIANTHMLLERWIRENPGQWLWLHRRWDSKGLKEGTHEAHSL